ncbi:hypothetical protein Tco_0491209 [Tanacetum coccineum]
MLVEMIGERKKFFAAQRATKSYEEILKLFDKAYKQVNSFVPMDSEVVKGSETRTEGSSKRAGDELESDNSKKQKIDEHIKARVDAAQNEENILSSYNYLCSVSAADTKVNVAGYKLQLLSDNNCWKDLY